MSIESQIEAILFVASKPLSTKVLARALGKKEDEIVEALEHLNVRYNTEHSGIHILSQGDDVMMGTNPSHREVIEEFVKDEVAGELTKAQLETLTVIAYRGPITRPELEQIRGVNCALILRNLSMRGLIEEKEDASQLTVVYTLSFDAFRHLGIDTPAELPEYASLHAHPHLENTVNDSSEV